MKITLWLSLLILLAGIGACGDGPTALPTEQAAAGTPGLPSDTPTGLPATPTLEPPPRHAHRIARYPNP